MNPTIQDITEDGTRCASCGDPARIIVIDTDGIAHPVCQEWIETCMKMNGDNEQWLVGYFLGKFCEAVANFPAVLYKMRRNA